MPHFCAWQKNVSNKNPINENILKMSNEHFHAITRIALEPRPLRSESFMLADALCVAIEGA